MSRVLAVRLDNEGDVLLAGPAIRALAAGAEHLTLLCGPRGRHAAALLPGVDDVIVWRAPWIDADPPAVSRADVAQAVEEIAELDIERAVIFGSFHQSPLPTALMLRLAAVRWVGAISDDYPGSLLDLRHRVRDDLHEVQRALSLARAAGAQPAPGDDDALAIVRPRAESIARPFADGYVVVHPGASVPARAWPANHHRNLVDALVAAGRPVVVTGGPSERGLTRRVAGAPRPGVCDLGGRTSFAELAEILAGAECVVVGNTGPAHLAAAVGTPVVSLFAPTIPAVRWHPWRVPHELLRMDVPCAGCRARDCPVEGHPCMSGVGVAEVVAAVERLARPTVAAAVDRTPAGALA